MLSQLLRSPLNEPVNQLTASIRAGWAPPVLFANGEQGAWYDPSDFSSMYQDSAGATPVTAVEQPVGLLLDKRLGLVRGSELVTNGTFDTDVAGWTAGIGTIAWAAGSLEVTRSAGTSSGYQAETTVVGQWYEVTASQRVVSGGTSANIVVREGNDPGVSPVLSNGTANASTSWNQNRCIFKATGTTSYIHLTAGVTTGVCGFDNVSIRSLAGNHATQATAASRPVLKQDASGKYYLNFDGVDDGMATGSIDFTATDKMTVWAGVHKASDAAGFGTIVELSTVANAGNPGSFGLFGPSTAGTATYRVNLAANASGTADLSTYTAPISNVISLTLDTALAAAASEIVARINGTAPTYSLQVASGTGNFGNYPLYIGRRGGTTLPYNGRLYGLIVRGAAASDSLIVKGERWTAAKMGVTL